MVDGVLEALGLDQVVCVKYHMNWPAPGNDPWYWANPEENTARRTYYGVNAIPTVFIDGIYSPNPWSSSDIQSNISSRLLLSSPLEIQTDVQVVGDTIYFTANLTSSEDLSTEDLRFHSVLVEQEVIIPPAPNGETNFKYPMVDMVPDGYGTAFSIAAGEQLEFQNTFAVDEEWSITNLLIVCFVQNNISKEIYQAAYGEIPIDMPNILLTDYQVSDSTGNGDGRVDPGEIGALVVTLQNQIYFADAYQVAATLATEDPLINITMPTISYVALGSGASVTNDDNPFLFEVDSTFAAHEVTFTLTVTAETGNFEATYPISFMVGRPDILLVNDDVNGSLQSWYTDPLDSLGRVYDAWNQVQSGDIPETEMLPYPIIIWYTGNDATSVLTEDEQQKIQNYLAAGGHLLFSSQNAGDLLEGTAFYQDVLHAQHLASTTNEYLLDGVVDDPISDGASLFLAGTGGANNANSSSSFDPISPAVGIFSYQNAGTFGALRCATDNYRLIYFAFAFEAISGGLGTTTRTDLLESCLEWLESEVSVEPMEIPNALPKRFEIASIYPNPFNPETDIRFSLPSAGYADLNVYNLQGQLVRQLVNGYLEAGVYKIGWEAGALPSGIYIVSLRAGTLSKARKAILLR